MFQTPLVVKLDPEYLATPAAAWMKARGVQRLVYLDPLQGTRQVWPWRLRGGSLEDVPAPVLRAIMDVMRREKAGMESDLLVRTSDGERYPVSLVWTLDGELQAAMGASMSTTRPALATKEEVARRWGVTLIEAGGARWKADETALLDRALGLLTEAERACLVDVPIVVTDASPPRSGDFVTLAHYTFLANEKPRIVFFATDEDIAQTSFLGEVDDPTPFSVHLFVHEFGHALADADRRRAWEPILPLWAALGELCDEHDGWRGSGASRGCVFPEHSPEQAKLEELVAAVQAHRDSNGASGDLLEQLQGPRTVERVWTEVMADTWRPTRYGQDDDVEGFADFFALVHADPAAMRRVAPDVVSWFESGGHLCTQ